ncbi:MAG: PEP-CTERM sorting domain-containing protein [Phycisphaerales bacterium]|nr:PEP-CTERM sorting domain-containing protein [Phycisphaerales bacterium]
MFARHARRYAMLIAAAAAAGFAAASQAATYYWNPTVDDDGLFYFNHRDANFSVNPDGSGGYVAPSVANPYDDVVFGGVGGNVPVGIGDGSDTRARSITLNGNYTLSGGPIFFHTNYIPGDRTIVRSTGTNTISSTIRMPDNLSTQGVVRLEVNLDAMDVGKLTLANITATRGQFQKTGEGLLVLNATSGTSAFDVTAGKLLIDTSNYKGTSCLVVGEAGTFAGSGTFDMNGSDNVLITNYPGRINSTVGQSRSVHVLGHIAPGSVTVGSNFGDVGNLTFQGPSAAGNYCNTTFYSSANLDLDLNSLASHDSLTFISGNYATHTVHVHDGAKININDGVGTLEVGSYRVFTFVRGGDGYGYVSEGFLNYVGNGHGFTIGAVPAGYNYLFETVHNTSNGRLNAMDLIVSTGESAVTIHDGGDRFAFGTVQQTPVAAGGAYGGISSSVKDTTRVDEPGGGEGMLGTAASILHGEASAATVVKMSWRTLMADEAYPTNSVPPFHDSGSYLISDVVNISGMGSDFYVLQMTYDDALADDNTPCLARYTSVDPTGGEIGMFNEDGPTGYWESVGIDSQFHLGSFDHYVLTVAGGDYAGLDLEALDGLWGVGLDADGNNVVWAIVSHDGQFAVMVSAESSIPEPASLTLLGLGSGLLLLSRKRRA